MLTGESFSYLKAGMRGPLLVAGVALVVLGALTIVQDRRASGHAAANDPCTGHEGTRASTGRTAQGTAASG